MKSGWAGFLANSRLESAERGMADMRETLALLAAQAPAIREQERGLADVRATLESLAAQAPAIGEQARALAELSERVAALEAGSQARQAAEAGKADDAFLQDARMEVMGEDLVRMRGILAGLERRLNNDMDEVRTIAAGLIERIENDRKRSGS